LLLYNTNVTFKAMRLKEKMLAELDDIYSSYQEMKKIADSRIHIMPSDFVQQLNEGCEQVLALKTMINKEKRLHRNLLAR
jgi:hypothetical protein